MHTGGNGPCERSGVAGKDGGNGDILRQECKATKREFGANGMRTATFIASTVTAGTAFSA